MGCGAPAPRGDRTMLNPDWFHTGLFLSLSFSLSLSLSYFLSLPPSRVVFFLSLARALFPALSLPKNASSRARAPSLLRVRVLSHTHTLLRSLSPICLALALPKNSQSDCLSAACILYFIQHTRALSLPLCRPSFLALSRSLSRARAFSLASTRVRLCVWVNLQTYTLCLPPPFRFSCVCFSLSLALSRSLSLARSLFSFSFSLSRAPFLFHTHTHTRTHTHKHRLQPIAEYVCAAGSGRLRARPQRLRWRRLHRPRLQPPRLLLKQNPTVICDMHQLLKYVDKKITKDFNTNQIN